MTRAAWLGAALALSAGQLAAQQTSAEAVLTRAARTYQTLTTFQAEFRQQIDDPYVDQAETRGMLYQAGPSRFAMRFTDPAGGVIVVSGDHAWFYDPENTPGQATRMSVRDDPVYGFNRIGWFLDRPGDKYRSSWVRTESLDGHPCDVLLLEPLDPTLPFRRATVWIDQESALPRRFEIDEKIQTRTLTLSRLRTNAAIPPDVFVFKPPKGVRVVEQ